MARKQHLVLPDLGMGEVPIRASVWLVERGAIVTLGDPLLEVVAGSVTVDLPAPASGVLARRLVLEDETLHLGQRLAVITADDGAAEP
jgi:pyruvate/2-oxoglutarate dehydrogenase complex dihydrolipoamide acyltransferase (E2) component